MAYPQQLVGYHSPYVWQLSGDLSAAPLSAVAALSGGALAAIGAVAGQGSFDGFREVFISLFIDSNLSPVPGVSLTVRQKIAGASGNTVVELYRFRTAGTWTLLCTCTLGFAAGNGGAATVSVGSLALGTLNAADILVCVLVGVQTGNPEDITSTVSFG